MKLNFKENKRTRQMEDELKQKALLGISKLTQENQKMATEINQNKQEIQNLIESIKKLVFSISSKAKDINENSSKLDLKREEVSHIRLLIQSDEDKIKELNQTIKDLYQIKVDKSKKQEKEKIRLQKTFADLESATTQIEQVQEKYKTPISLDTIQNSYNEKIEKWNKKSKTFQQELEKIKLISQNQEEEKKQIQLNLDEIIQQITRCEDSIANYDDKIQNLKQQIAYNYEIIDKQTEIKEKEIRKLKMLEKSKRQKETEISALSQNNSIKKDKYEQQIIQNAQIQKEIETLKKDFLDNAKLQIENAQIEKKNVEEIKQNEISEKNKMIEDLKNQIEDFKNKIFETKQKITILNQEKQKEDDSFELQTRVVQKRIFNLKEILKTFEKNNIEDTPLLSTTIEN